MKKLKTLLLAATLVMSFSSPIIAAEFKIGTVDMRAVMTTSPQMKSAMEKLKKEFKTREEQLIAADKSLKEKTEKLQRNASVMNDVEKSKLEKEILVGQRDLQRMQTEYREDAGVRQQEEMKKVMDRINTVVNEVAKKEKYDLILHSDVAPYAAREIDLTSKVQKALSTSA